MMNIKDISKFQTDPSLFDGTELVLVVKSQNQLERRQNMITYLTTGKIGRAEQRGVATGLLVRGRVANGVFNVDWTREYLEPRHIVPFHDGYLLTAIDRIIILDNNFKETQQILHPDFSGLHALNVSADQTRFLVTSSGFDRLLEFTCDGDSFHESWSWKGWEHGFNPTDEGVWITDDPELRRSYEEEGKPVCFIDKREYGPEGVPIAKRTMHPNIAVYDKYDGERSIILSSGVEGELFRIDRFTKKVERICNHLHKMPHGLIPFREGWAIVDTTVGEWVQMDRQFNVEERYSVKNVLGKPAIASEYEWVQNFVPYRTGLFLVDANRGIFAVDLETDIFTLYTPNENWCIQDILPV